MHSIWGEICLVNIILVDLTDFNANMALELGIHSTGFWQTYSSSGQEGMEKQLFAHVEMFRVGVYKNTGTLSRLIGKYFS